MHEAIPLLPLDIFMAWRLVKHRDNFTFTLSNCILNYFTFKFEVGGYAMRKIIRGNNLLF
jgi:hypothetical protein